MTEWDRLHRQAKIMKERYPAGTRIMLLRMGNDPRPVEPNTKGTVIGVDDIGTVHCKFDNGRSLGVVSARIPSAPSPTRNLRRNKALTRAKLRRWECEVIMQNYTIEIPNQYVESLLHCAAETGLSGEEIVESAIKKILERRMTDNA